MPRPAGPAPASATLLAAVVQYEALGTGSGGAAVARNVAAHAELVEKAHADGARLVLFPELSLTGYELDSFDAPEHAGERSAWLTDGDTRLQPLRDACASTGTTAVIGAGWREADGTPRLASLIVGPDGSLRPAFKTHLHGAEREVFVAGNGPEIMEVDGWRVALAVCADAAQTVPRRSCRRVRGRRLRSVSPVRFRRGIAPRTAPGFPVHGPPDVRAPGQSWRDHSSGRLLRPQRRVGSGRCGPGQGSRHGNRNCHGEPGPLQLAWLQVWPWRMRTITRNPFL